MITELRNVFKNNYSTFVKNILNLTYKIKFSYELKSCRPIDLNNSSSYYVELSSTVRDVFNYSTKKVIESFLLNEEKTVKLSSTCIEESGSILYRNTFLDDDKLEVRFLKNQKNDKETNLEIWYDSVLSVSLKIEDYGITKIYFDDVFGKPKFSPDGKKIIFIAEVDTCKSFKNYFGIKEEGTQAGQLDESESEKSEEKENTKNNVNSQNTKNSKIQNLEKNLSKFEYKQDFGEALKDKSSPRIFIYDILESKFYNINLENYPKVFPACPMLDQTNKDIIFSGYNLENFKYGLIYCLKRKSSIYLIHDPVLEEMSLATASKKLNPSSENSQKENILINLSPKEYSNLYPIFSPNFKHLVWFANENATPHMNGLKLYSLDYENKKKMDLTPVSDYSTLNDNSNLLIDKIKKENEYFNGIYSYEDSISLLNFLSDDLFIFSSQHKNTDDVLIFDIMKKRLLKLPSNLNSQKIVSVKRNVDQNMGLIFTLCSDVATLPHASLVKFNYLEYHKDQPVLEQLENGISYVKEYNENIFSNSIITDNNLNLFNNFSKNDLNLFNREFSGYLNEIIKDTQVDDLKINGVHGHIIYLKSFLQGKDNKNNFSASIRDENWKSPVVYFIHGGPNSLIEKMFLLAQVIFLAHGYSVLVINYPGSTGYGQDYLSSLSGNIGKLDVDSCGEFLTAFLKMEKYSQFIDANNIMLYGGSHGGYLSCWLVVHEKYCKMFSSAVIRNPVTDLVSSMATTDIPDWVLGQSTDLDIEDNYPPSKETYNKMYDASPIFLAKNCVTPSLMCLGKADKRVSMFNGLYFYEAIRKYGCETKCLMYPEDGHPLSSPETEVDCLFNICYWFEKHLKN
jgi:acylaminoacyl-peptidase